MKELLDKSAIRIQQSQLKFRRYLIDKVRWNNRLIAITGARGCGKTTMLLQHAHDLQLPQDAILYLSLDDVMLKNQRLVTIADWFYKNGGQCMLIDEVHKYPDWSLEIKNIYDTYPQLKVIFTGSSVLEIYKGEADLSRRAIEYPMHNLSLREFIAIKDGVNLPVFSFDDILQNHTNHTQQINSVIRPVKYFNEYLRLGAFPYFIEDTELYHSRLLHTLNLALEIDITTVTAIDYSAVVKLKQLVSIIGESVPFKPNILKLSERLGIKRDTLIKYLHLLERARVLILLNSSAKGMGTLSKPDKIYLHNTNLLSALMGVAANIGTMRETFLINQLMQAHVVNYTQQGDFLVDNKFVFEVGGVNKSTKQIKNLKNAFLALDDIEHGSKNTIPLWLFGFMY